MKGGVGCEVESQGGGRGTFWLFVLGWEWGWEEWPPSGILPFSE